MLIAIWMFFDLPLAFYLSLKEIFVLTVVPSRQKSDRMARF